MKTPKDAPWSSNNKRIVGQIIVEMRSLTAQEKLDHPAFQNKPDAAALVLGNGTVLLTASDLLFGK